jgi:hypothetical protein
VTQSCLSALVRSEGPSKWVLNPTLLDFRGLQVNEVFRFGALQEMPTVVGMVGQEDLKGDTHESTI